ncbi:MAG TPA: hypothetical protein VN442_20780 [Bryobacteraceae bacterium]|nr:hypothetical protein [Bryobacteraceae bacterium]
MRSAISLLMLPALAMGAGLPYFSVLAEEPGAWPAILECVGLRQAPASTARVFVVRAGAMAAPEWTARVQGGAVLILEGESSLAEMFGFRRGKESVRAGSVTDVHDPKLPIVWEHPVEMPVFRVPEGAQVFARERWTGAPLVAGMRRGSGAVLWVALPPGERGYERFPYLLQALADLGLEAPFHSARLWAFFDYSYRLRADPEYFAQRWRNAGISALHVGVWHFFERDAARDEYLARLIAACHRHAIQVYGWLELPHVSERFWLDHPEWREKTAVGQDAHLDWRKLMNLQNRACAGAVAAGVKDLVRRFDWDGVNLAELYFESLEGISNPSRFTPLNADARGEFRLAHGFDPQEVFGTRNDAASRRKFLDFRSNLAIRMQQEWLSELDNLRKEKPHLDLVLTHVDDRLDARMRDAIGADAAATLPLIERVPFTFMVEDPATVWNQGPQRYREIANRYRALKAPRERLAIDINIVDRYQSVYPTKQQTGTELFQLVHTAASAFERVALYFENSLRRPDLALLPAAAAAVTRVEEIGPKLAVESPSGVGVPWSGPALVDGKLWPIRGERLLWLPVGAHMIEPGISGTASRVLDFNGELQSARYGRNGAIEVAYRSQARAFAVLERPAVRVELDGIEVQPDLCGTSTLVLPRGQHLVTIQTQ